ncbi:MAG: A/G-specific adenine glycosylase [Bacteroidales bacterium]|nr:A/G-specific adenine glycosylase [Bacteroidales bacterium]
MKTITKILEKWYIQNKRNLPWRKTKSAYKIWLSEIILQQTRVNQGVKYYRNFLERFPDVNLLAEASLEEVLKVWQGLGYYTRARNLHATARKIVQEYNGCFPADYKALLLLPGIGEYTAAAIASIAFDLPVALVDGNVLRVLARLFGVSTPVTSSGGKNEVYARARCILNNKNPGLHNQALMELGALICLPRNPYCNNCPVSTICYARMHDKINELPVKALNIKTKKRYFHYLHITWRGKVFLHQRKQKDIWNSLYEFPLIETRRAVKPDKLPGYKQWNQLLQGIRHQVNYVTPLYKHVLSHQTLYARFYQIHIGEISAGLAEGYTCIKEKKIFEYPVSRLTEKYLHASKLI